VQLRGYGDQRIKLDNPGLFVYKILQKNFRKEFSPMNLRSMDTIRRDFTTFTFVGCVALILIIFLTGASYGATAQKIDSGVGVALRRFSNEVEGGRELLQKAKGVLVFPKVIKAGLGIGGEYGEGALRVGGQTVDYYATAAGSMGIQLGGQTKMVIICFMEEEALKRFRNSSAWKAGVDASAVAINFGAGTSVDTIANGDPVVGFIFGQEGLMFDANLEGGKLTKLKR
jgi:lipid-binding SYLF domain-containing protein